MIMNNFYLVYKKENKDGANPWLIYIAISVMLHILGFQLASIISTTPTPNSTHIPIQVINLPPSSQLTRKPSSQSTRKSNRRRDISQALSQKESSEATNQLLETPIQTPQQTGIPRSSQPKTTGSESITPTPTPSISKPIGVPSSQATRIPNSQGQTIGSKLITPKSKPSVSTRIPSSQPTGISNSQPKTIGSKPRTPASKPTPIPSSQPMGISSSQPKTIGSKPRTPASKPTPMPSSQPTGISSSQEQIIGSELITPTPTPSVSTRILSSQTKIIGSKLITPTPTPSVPKPTPSPTPTPTPVRDKDLPDKSFKEDLDDDVTPEMVKIPGGTFIMGSPERENGRDSNESPQHQVNVPTFFMSKFEITQEQYQQVMGENPSYFKGYKHPVENVSWNDAVEFCRRLSLETGRNYRLPTEAEWEYAARAGTTTPFYSGEIITSNLANYGNNNKGTTEVGTFPPNAFGLHDMHGNVFEWVQDHWHENYIGAPTNGSAWIGNSNDSSRRVLRGGSWLHSSEIARSARRGWWHRYNKTYHSGFRVVLDDVPEEAEEPDSPITDNGF
ncbi:MAG: SUMF1/EgtB/PvdO family nonheme iron enzyme [Calothrix sp. MO_167.B12]|nr:SUMF1/EgtB/PvdO family nonheme iron enzyme [Calothrix sp. MO_167.B12]